MLITKKQWIVISSVLGVCALVIGSLYWFTLKLHEASQNKGLPVIITEQEFLSVQGENTLLKKMLGQINGNVIVIGPVEKKSQLQGKLVWDKTLQAGFLHLTGLDPSITYQLILKSNQGVEQVVAESVPAVDPWQVHFKSSQRLLDLASVEIRSSSTNPKDQKDVHARGVVTKD